MGDSMRNCRIIFVVMLSAFLFGCGNSRDDKQLTIESFTEVLESNEIYVGEKSDKWYALLMATDGYGIDVNGSQIEVYQFDYHYSIWKRCYRKMEKRGLQGAACNCE
jgi:hypothetical protein